MDLNDLMKMAGQLKEQLGRAQDEAAKLRGKGEAGGGLVSAVMNGRHELVELSIDPSAISKDDPQMLEDLIRAAVNQATLNVASALKDRLGGVAGSMGIDLSDLAKHIPGGGDPR